MRAAIAGSRATGLAEVEIRYVVGQELDGLYVTRVEEDVRRHAGWAEGGE
jgi:hypothetical protein